MPRVYVSSVIDASADRVWSIVRDFNGLPRWMPVVADSRIEGGQPSDKVGCIRNFNLKNGGNRAAAELVGKRIAEKAKSLGIENVAFDRSGFRFHGRVKALAEAARAGGLKF